MSAQYSISSVSTAGSKALKVLDNTNSKIYTFPQGSGLVVENYSSDHYTFFVTHQNVGRLTLPIAAINDFGGTPPNGSNYATDYATFVALMP